MRLALLTPLLLAACADEPADTTLGAEAPKISVMGRFEHPGIVEASGIAASQRFADTLWIINDGDAPPIAYASDLVGRHRALLAVAGARNRDWEDLAAFRLDGRAYLLIADIGDNEGQRKRLRLYVVPEPDIRESRSVSVPPSWRIDFRYPDGPRDAEAVAVDAIGRRVYVLSKRDMPPVLYSVPLVPEHSGTIVATRHGTVLGLPQPTRDDMRTGPGRFDWHWQPTAMDFTPDGTRAVILTYRAAYHFRKTPDEDWLQILSRMSDVTRLRGLRDAEAVAFDAYAGAVFVTTEGAGAPLVRIRLDTGNSR